MIQENSNKQNRLELVCIENLVPENHLLRLIDKHIRFNFIYDLVKDLYCEDNGRPALDPVVLFKMLFLGYLYGIRSERQLEREIQVNVAYRWFLGLSFTDEVPDHSTISQNRRRRFKGTDVFQKVFDEIVLQGIEHKLISGKVLYTDSTHLKANANKRKLIIEQVEKSVKDYVDELEQAIEEDRVEHGKNPLKKKPNIPETKEIKVSTTDPESGYMVRDGKPKGFFYLDHRTVDIKHNLITDVFVTPGNINDVDPYLSRLDRQVERFGFNVKYVGLDAGYFTNPICKGLADRSIQGAIGFRLGPHVKGKYTKNKFQYIKELDVYVCPSIYPMHYKTTTREGYREYVSSSECCDTCPNRDKCLTSDKSTFRTIRRHVWEEFKDSVAVFVKTEKGRRIYKRRKETVERSFADAKELHGLRYCRMRGLEKVSEQCLLTAACMNMKKIATILGRRSSSFLNRYSPFLFKSIYEIA